MLKLDANSARGRMQVQEQLKSSAPTPNKTLMSRHDEGVPARRLGGRLTP